MDGSCHESPRWVSLLVAEIFYPDARFPNPVPIMASPTSRFDAPNGFSSSQPFVGPTPEVKKTGQLHPSGQQIHRPVGNQQTSSWRSIESPSSGARRMKRQSSSSSEEEGNDIDKKQPQEENQCDGVDKIGCYTVRVYYDWFLIPGSCKCWKKTTQGGLDALKKIFIGK